MLGELILIGQKCNLCQKALFYKAFSVFWGKIFDLLFFATFSEPSGLEPTTLLKSLEKMVRLSYNETYERR